MKHIMENWREFIQETTGEAALLKEVKSVCASYKKGTLKPQSLNEQQFLEQLGELYVLYEQGKVSRRGFLKGLGAPFKSNLKGFKRGAQSFGASQRRGVPFKSLLKCF